MTPGWINSSADIAPYPGHDSWRRPSCVETVDTVDPVSYTELCGVTMLRPAPDPDLISVLTLWTALLFGYLTLILWLADRDRRQNPS